MFLMHAIYHIQYLLSPSYLRYPYIHISYLYLSLCVHVNRNTLLGHTDAIQALQIKSIRHPHTTLPCAVQQSNVCLYCPRSIWHNDRKESETLSHTFTSTFQFFLSGKKKMFKVSSTLVFYVAVSKRYLSTLNAFSLAECMCLPR